MKFKRDAQPKHGLRVKRKVQRVNGDAVVAQTLEQVDERLARIAIAVESHARKLIGKSGMLGRYRSKPGDPPLRQRSILIGSLRSWKKAVCSYGIGTAKEAYYARYLEFGTRHMAARPFLRRALYEVARKEGLV